VFLVKNGRDKLYEEFYDPNEDFKREPRAFCYDLAVRFISEAKEATKDNWYEDENTVKGILLLLFTWNFAAKKTKALNFGKIRSLLGRTKDELRLLEGYTIENADEHAWERIKKIFKEFRNVVDQTGASKALSLLNPQLFVMWDTAIRARLRRDLIPGIENGEEAEHYVTFLKGIQGIVKRYGIREKLPPNSVVAKKVDEYNYVRIVMPNRAI
jgi:hypothetical protein